MSGRIFEQAHAALDRMRRAHARGTGCHLTAEMIRDLGLTFLGETWGEEGDCEPYADPAPTKES